MNSNVSIIGCGWLGLDLAKLLITRGYNVKGSTTSTSKIEMLKSLSIHPFSIRINEVKIEGEIDGFLSNSDTLIINIPPGLRKNPEKNHINEITLLETAIERSDIKHVLYISSTSVFEDSSNCPVITYDYEPNGTSNSARQLIEIENKLKSNSHFRTTILRFSGLIGSDRHPGKILSGRKNIPNPHAPVNLIHKLDCLAIVETILDKNLWNISLNASYPLNQDRKSYYTDYCKKYNLPVPDFEINGKNKGKFIDCSKMVQLLDYQFKATP